MAATDDQQFCLRWNNFQANITSQFETLRDDEDFVDVTLACQGQKLEAHKVVLSACSPFFKELFKSNPCPHPIIFMRDVEARHVAALLEFMYAGEVNVCRAQLSDFLRTAESLQIRGLSDASKVQRDEEQKKENDLQKRQYNSEIQINASPQSPHTNSTSTKAPNGSVQSKKAQSSDCNSRSQSPNLQGNQVTDKRSEPYLQYTSGSARSPASTPPPTKRKCKTEYEMIDEGDLTKRRVELSPSPASTSSNLFANINASHLNCELDLPGDMIEPKTEPDYTSDDEQMMRDGRMDETLLGFEGTDLASSFVKLDGGMEIGPSTSMGEISQDSNQGMSSSSRRVGRRRLLEDAWFQLPLAVDMSSGSGSGGLQEADRTEMLTRLAAAGWRSNGHPQPRSSGGVVKLGEGIEICEEQLRSVKWSDYRKLTRGLATILFSPLELATCSVTGQRWSRAGTGERPVKPALDRAKVQAIISYVATRFPMVEISRIKQVLAYKCKENSTAFKMKAIRFFGDQQLQSQENT